MKRGWIAVFVFTVACASGHSIMTMESFYDIPVGADTQQVVAAAGKPNHIRNVEGGVEYEYIERMKAGARLLQERRYIFTIKGGKVTAKRMEQNSPLPATFDSYEMQTTQGDNSFSIE